MENITRRDAIKKATLLMGGIISTPTVLGVLNGCAASPEIPWKPSFFTDSQAVLVAEIAETILPETDTPGAKKLGVPKFIEDMVAKVYQKDRREAFVKGINRFDKECIESTGKSFISLDKELKTTYLNKRNDEIIKKAIEDSIPPFFYMIKELTIVGYFTTEVGARQVLQYKLIPTRYDGCISLEEAGGRTWAI